MLLPPHQTHPAVSCTLYKGFYISSDNDHPGRCHGAGHGPPLCCEADTSSEESILPQPCAQAASASKLSLTELFVLNTKNKHTSVYFRALQPAMFHSVSLCTPRPNIDCADTASTADIPPAKQTALCFH